MRLSVLSLLCACLTAPAFPTSAGTVEVRFANTGSYTDAGATAWEEEATLQTLAQHLKAIGPRSLPANQVLKVVVLDVDLAGTVRPVHRGSGDVRIVRGGADFPRMHLQYTLEADGKPVRSGDEWLGDLTYTDGLSGSRRSGPLYYERRMIDDWFKARFAQGANAGN